MPSVIVSSSSYPCGPSSSRCHRCHGIFVKELPIVIILVYVGVSLERDTEVVVVELKKVQRINLDSILQHAVTRHQARSSSPWHQVTVHYEPIAGVVARGERYRQRVGRLIEVPVRVGRRKAVHARKYQSLRHCRKRPLKDTSDKQESATGKVEVADGTRKMDGERQGCVRLGSYVQRNRHFVYDHNTVWGCQLLPRSI
eukprot:219129-Prorocentrum_minimum.AAC.5